MAATTSGTKTVTHDAAPHLTAAQLTTILAKPVELLTVSELHTLVDATKRMPYGGAPGSVIGDLLV